MDAQWKYRGITNVDAAEARRLCRLMESREGLRLHPAHIDGMDEVAESPNGATWYLVAEEGSDWEWTGWVRADSFFNARFELVLPDATDGE